MVTVSALAATLFLGGWRAPWPISIWDGANTGWWPLLWFFLKVVVGVLFSSSSGCAARCPGSATTSSCGSAGRLVPTALVLDPRGRHGARLPDRRETLSLG